jgi:hypothetical protein
MSQFREQLHAAQLSYHAPLYPDDLASQLFPPKRNIWPRIIGTLVVGAVAAIVVVVLLNEAIVQPQAQHDVVMQKQQAPEGVHFPAVPQMPQNEMPAPPSGDQPLFLPSLPSFPSFGEVIGGSSQTKESPKEAPKTRESL